MKIITGWRQSWRLLSVQALALLAAVPLIWDALPYDVKEWIPPELRPYIIALLAVAGIAGRLIKQPDVHK